MGPSWLVHLSLLGLSLVSPAVSKDECQPSTWKLSSALRVGDINCRMSQVAGPKADVNTCATMARKWDITIDKFYDLNPRLNGDCKNILPNIRYCVDGFPEPLRAYNGRCGPNHNNATCVGTDNQCCNKNTWVCGDTEDDCTLNCYEGLCY
ncbi:hypothetical protein FPOAC1_007600 [Fusarium poae]|uniref:LysM domain-containing protein n=1 Tax=Fusarium poae TaxID=36050 RepID=A0A1B8AIZ3_FUSPO|nr:hypothetical protein FPOAC1_007600 [Fusarium poae]KAG8668223.1 hypothetical protein FPOAC1_007600 [Fusarium poae]OBS20326.1 hypothetical protein FPOA_06699 [Fusarium poae]